VEFVLSGWQSFVRIYGVCPSRINL